MRINSIIAGLLCLAVASAGSLVHAEQNDFHKRESFMPNVEGWKIIGRSHLASEKRRFRPDKAVPGAEIINLKSEDGNGGCMVVVKGVVLLKGGEVAKNHTHVSIRTENNQWVLGEGSTLTMQQTIDGLVFCLEDYFTKNPVCSAEIQITG